MDKAEEVIESHPIIVSSLVKFSFNGQVKKII